MGLPDKVLALGGAVGLLPGKRWGGPTWGKGKEREDEGAAKKRYFKLHCPSPCAMGESGMKGGS